MSEINDGGHAFPECRGDLAKGMTMRDYFAAQAMTAVQNAVNYYSEVSGNNPSTREDDAIECYRRADAMLAARGMK